MPTTLDLESERTAPQEPRYVRREYATPPEPPRSRAPLWAAVAALGVGLGATAWYANSRIGDQDGLIGELRGWPAAVSAVRQRVVAAEQRLADLPKDFDALHGRLTGLDSKVTAGLARTQKESREMGSSLRKEIASVRSGVSAQEQASAARIRELESQQQAQVTRTAQLEREVARLNTQVAGLRGDLNSASDGHARETAALRQDLQRTTGRVEQVASFGNRARTRFEATPGKTVEIAPGLLLHISKVDVRYRRFAGWLQLVNDSARFLWLRDQSVLQTVPFYTGKQALRHDLVVTDLSPGGVTGYLIFPTQSELQAGQ